MSTILALSSSADTGKTETVRSLANLLLRHYPSFTSVLPIPAHVPTRGDFRLIVRLNGKTVALESEGDPKTLLQNRLTDIITNFNPDLIVCTTRTRGETVNAVDNIANQFNYDTIWTSPYHVNQNFQQINDAKAGHLLDLLVVLGVI